MLGSPSITDSFDDNTYIYIERKTSSSQLRKLGKRQLIKNNILLLELNNKGMLVKKTLLDKENMKKLKFSEDITGDEFGADSAVYNFIKALRNKINDPLGQKK